MPLAHTAEVQQRGPEASWRSDGWRTEQTSQAARAELETINRRLEAAYPATNRGVVPRVDTYSQFFVGPDAPIIYGSLWVAAWFVLLIACANLANLTVARTDRAVARIFDQDCARRGALAHDPPDSFGEPAACGRGRQCLAGGSRNGACARGPRQPRPFTRYSTTR